MVSPRKEGKKYSSNNALEERERYFVCLLTCLLKTYQKVNFVFEPKQLYLKMFITVILVLSHGHAGRNISINQGGMWLYPRENHR